MKRVPTQDCLRKSFNTHLRKMLTRRLRPKQNSLRDFSTVPFLYKPNHLQKNVAHMWKICLDSPPHQNQVGQICHTWSVWRSDPPREALGRFELGGLPQLGVLRWGLIPVYLGRETPLRFLFFRSKMLRPFCQSLWVSLGHSSS